MNYRYDEFVAIARKAAKAAKDPELRSIAFGRILDHLLQDYWPNEEERRRKAKEKKKAQESGNTDPKANPANDSGTPVGDA